jgi:hypothetical protein
LGVVTAALLFTVQLGRAQDFDVVLFNLQATATKLAGKWRNEPEFQKKTSDLVRQIGRFQDITADTDRKVLGPYAQVLQHHVRLLTDAGEVTDVKQAIAIVSDVSADLNLKIASSASLGIGPAFRGVIEVTVLTKQDDTQVSGYLVHANPIRWKNSNPMFSFPGLSSPTTHSIPPGIYEIVALRGDKAVRRTADVGLSGQDKVTIDVPVR